MAVCFDPQTLRGTQVRYVPLRLDSVFQVPRKAFPLPEDALCEVLADVRRRAAIAQHSAPPMLWIPARDYFDNLIPGAGVADLKAVAAQLQERLRRANSLFYLEVDCWVAVVRDTIAVRVWLSRGCPV